jgi:hypothetical protein
MYGADRVNAAVGRAERQNAMSKATSRGMVGGAIAGAALNAPEEIRKGVRLVQDPKGATQDALNDSGITIFGKGPRMRGQEQKASNKQKADNNSRLAANERVKAGRLQAATPPPKTANQGQATRQAEQRRSVGATTASPAPRQSPVRPSQSQPRSVASGTAGTGRKWEDFNTGRGTSETNNPLIKKDPWLMSKLKEREDGQAKNVGPVKDGGEYSASKKAAEIVERRKKKEEEEKKKAAQ